MQWIRQSQERDDQKYFFNGKCLVTRGVQELLNEEETLKIISELQQLAKEKDGLDYLQVYKNENEQKVWIIDQLDEKMKTEHPPEHDHFTILLPSEY